jgi:hypothetical protein
VEIAFPTQTLYLKRGTETEAETFEAAFGRDVRSGKERVRRDVRQMVDDVLGGQVPPPVQFATSRLDGEAAEGDE